MSPELEILDQLAGGDQSVELLVPLFADVEHAARALAAMVRTGDVVLRVGDRELRHWEVEPAVVGRRGVVSLTDQGAAKLR